MFIYVLHSSSEELLSSYQVDYRSQEFGYKDRPTLGLGLGGMRCVPPILMILSAFIQYYSSCRFYEGTVYVDTFVSYFSYVDF